MMAREHGSRILNWWRRLRTCDRLALVMAIILAAAVVREMPVSSDDGGTAAWDAPPQPYDASRARQQLWGGSNATRLPTVAACARVRNEGPYLREWIEFHLLTGMSHFYIFDDASSDNTRTVLEPYIQRGVVRLWSVQEKCPKHREEICVSREHDAEHGERGFRDECLRFNPDGAAWVAAIDVDEFLYPSAGTSLPHHLAQNCAPSLAYALVRWKVFGSGGYRRKPHGTSVDAYRARSVSDDSGCYPRLTCGDEYAPPVCAKVIARAKCVQKQGTHYVVQAEGCESIYAPEGSGRQIGKLAAPLQTDFARSQHASCSAPLRLNHYAVRSREEYVQKFSRGRISSGARDTKKGIATRGPNGGYLREVDERDREDFIDAEVIPKETRASKLTSTKDLMLAEFARRDFSTVLDEGAAVKYGALLRAKLNAPSLSDHQTWACSDTSRDSASLEAARVWHHLTPITHETGLFIHIPKTAGTSLNAILREASVNEKRRFCELSFKELDDRSSRFRRARSCHLVSAETDVSALLQWPSRKTVAAFTFLRDPLSRAVSQVEHHRSVGGRINEQGDPRTTLVRLVSPNLCPQLERDARCRFLRHPAKCLAGGWCGLFQNHQTQILAGALHVSEEARGAVRRSGENLLCAAKRSLDALPVVGLTERLADSLCLVFDALGYHKTYKDCCVHRKCPLLDRRETRHSGAARGNASYSASYFSDDVLLAALYEGNALDCALYAAAAERLGSDLAKLRPRAAPVSAHSARCRRGEAALRRLRGY